MSEERIANILGSRPLARIAALAAALAGAALVAGCGQKGPLYLPPAEHAPPHHTHTPPPAMPAATPASSPASTPARP